MGEVSGNASNLLSRINSMYDNPLFSDVELLFVKESGLSQKIFCHSFILAIRSETFAQMFFGDDSKRFSHKVKVPSSKASIWTQLVRFLYTDDLQLHTFKEAQELFDLATEYAVEELKEKCLNYILNGKLKIENLFSKYDYALLKTGMHTLLKECQKFVCANSPLVLQSDEFTNASIDVVEDIVKLDNLSVSTEIEVIGAVLKWGSEELKRRGLSLDEKNLKKCVEPLKKHLRFLTLSQEELDCLMDRYDIFSSKECYKLAQKRIDPDVVLPDSLSSVNVKRSASSCVRTSTDLYVNETVHLPINDGARSAIPSNNDSHLSRSLKNLNSEGTSKSPKSPTPHSGSSDVPTASDTSKFSFQIKKISAFDERKNSVLNPSSSLKDLSHVDQKVDGGYRLSLLDERSISVDFGSLNSKYVAPMVNGSSHKTAFDETRNSVDNPCSSLKEVARMLNMSSRLRDYEFSLQESVPCFRTSFQNDVKSSITFHMITGNVLLHGFEVKVENKSDKAIEEELAIDVDLKGFSKQPFSKLYQEKLKNNLIFIQLPESMVLQAGSKGMLEVSVDNLLLNRCCRCNSNKPLQLNCGNSFACEMTLNSTQKTETGFLFLVSKLIYHPC